MAFFDNVLGGINQATEVAKLNGTISSTERQINDLYRQIGYAIYCAHHQDPLPEVKEQIEQVVALHKVIDDCNAQIAAIKAADSCPQCGAHVGKGVAFCAACGYKLPVPEPSAAFCTGCGTALTPGSAFCPSCGQKIG